MNENVESHSDNSKSHFHADDPITFTTECIRDNQLENLCAAVESHYSAFDKSGILPTAFEYLLKHTDELAVLECLAFCKYEKSTDLEIDINPQVDIQAWINVKETNESATPAGQMKLDKLNPWTRQDSKTLFEDNRKGYMSSRPWILQLLIQSNIKTKAFVDKWWPLVIPAILNFLDTSDPLVKAKAIALTDLLVTNHALRLRNSGIIPVFEQSIEPCLYFLPPMSESEITIALHRPSLLCLAKLAQASDISKDSNQNKVSECTKLVLGKPEICRNFKLNSRMNFLAREGALKPFAYSHDKVELCIYFLDTLMIFSNEYLESLTIIHLHGIVQLLNQILCDPFIEFSPKLIEKACETMSVVIRWCWPRVEIYRYSLMLGLAKAKALDHECFSMLRPTDEEKQTLRQVIESS